MCNGNGMSCLLQANVQLVTVSANFANGTRFRDLNSRGLSLEAAQTLLVAILPVRPGSLQLAVSELPIQRSAVNGTFVFTRTVNADVAVPPSAVAASAQPYAQTYWLYQLLKAATLASSALLDNAGSITYRGQAVTARGAEVLLAAVTSVGRRGVCGNGLCELGELAPQTSNGTFAAPCAQDCPMLIKSCPRNAQTGEHCSGVRTPQPCCFSTACMAPTLHSTLTSNLQAGKHSLRMQGVACACMALAAAAAIQATLARCATSAAPLTRAMAASASRRCAPHIRRQRHHRCLAHLPSSASAVALLQCWCWR